MQTISSTRVVAPGPPMRGPGAATLDRLLMRIILSTMTEPSAAKPMTDSEYHRVASATLSSIEATVDRWLQDDVIDIDTHRTGGLLELAFADGSKIVVNQQPPLHELWLATRGGGYHYRYIAGRWIDTRDGSDFFATLSQAASRQGGRPLRFDPA